jgi:hypothetical protein
MFDGISDVNIVAEDGEMRYLDCKVCTSASLKPLWMLAGFRVSAFLNYEPRNREPLPQMIMFSQRSLRFETSSTDDMLR